MIAKDKHRWALALDLAVWGGMSRKYTMDIHSLSYMGQLVLEAKRGGL